MQDLCEILFTLLLYNLHQYIKLSPLEKAMIYGRQHIQRINVICKIPVVEYCV